MKFRFVILGPDDEPDGHSAAREVHHTASRALPYEQTGAGIIRRLALANGRWKMIPVTNFTARIVRHIIMDDGEEERREFGVEAEVAGQKLAFSISAAEFGRMGWVLQKLGPEAIVYPGQQQHARAAIQELSGPIRRECILLTWAGENTKANGCICMPREPSVPTDRQVEFRSNCRRLCSDINCNEQMRLARWREPCVRVCVYYLWHPIASACL